MKIKIPWVTPLNPVAPTLREKKYRIIISKKKKIPRKEKYKNKRDIIA